jgi:hypothetical protein
MKKRFPLELLIKARQVRVDAAMRQVEQARDQLRQCEQHRDACAERKTEKEIEHTEQRRRLIAGDDFDHPVIFASQFTQRERHLEMLVEQLEVLDQALLDAQHEVYVAQDALQEALANYRRLQAKLDGLIERKARWKVQLEIESDNADEVNAEEIFLAAHLKKAAAKSAEQDSQHRNKTRGPTQH